LINKYPLYVLLILSHLLLSACSYVIKPNIFEPSWMSYDKTNKKLNLELVAAWSANNNGFNFNGYFQDSLTIHVPADWLVNVLLINLDGNAPHSIVVTEPYTAETIPEQLTGEFAVLNRAFTDSIFANERTQMTFKTKTGDYWFFCGDKGQGINGMWVKFNVDKNIELPFIEIKNQLQNIRR